MHGAGSRDKVMIVKVANSADVKEEKIQSWAAMVVFIALTIQSAPCELPLRGARTRASRLCYMRMI
jgi:hypothetical protein